MMAFDERDTVVVVLPGLWMPAWVMLPLARRLRRHGYRCVRLGYAPVRASLDENARRLASFVRGLAAARIHLVGHSLGGVLALHATATCDLAQVRRIVLAGSPYNDSYVARKMLRWGWGRWMIGSTVAQWLACPAAAAPAGVDVGVIAGTRRLGLGMIVAPELEHPHDGVVKVEETRIEGMTDFIELDVNHAGMLLSERLAQQVAAFLHAGRFRRPGVDGVHSALREPCGIDRSVKR
ncbi:MAG: alpha/beta hydrolase [Burkholderiales bacterium]|nr:alpha/beta hydrolase [Burkholderiales bacterium]